MDSYGDEAYATRPIHHKVPEDVSREDLDFYGGVYSFMGFEDLLFYLYPIAREFERDKCLDCIDAFLYSLERLFPLMSVSLSPGDQEALLDGLHWIWNAAPLGYADWIQCPNLQAALGISVTWDDVGWRD